jgi:hypothetical protein
MKKGTFKIKMRSESRGWKWEEKAGFYSKHFGIFKAEELDQFSVTHLKTGLRLALFVYLRQARKFVELIEEKKDWPVAWDHSDYGNDYIANADEALEIRRKVGYDMPGYK